MACTLDAVVYCFKGVALLLLLAAIMLPGEALIAFCCLVGVCDLCEVADFEEVGREGVLDRCCCCYYVLNYLIVLLQSWVVWQLIAIVAIAVWQLTLGRI